MALKVSIRPSQLEEIRCFSALTDQDLKALLDHVAKLDHPLLGSKELEKQVEDALPQKAADAQLIARLIGSLAFLKRRKGIDGGQIADAIEIGLKADQVRLKIDNKLIIDFGAHKKALAQLLNQSLLTSSTKVVDLAFDSPNALQEIRINTDVRPVFSDSADSVLGAAIMHRLMIEISDARGTTEIEIVLTDADLKRVKEVAERALTKASIIENGILANGKIRAYRAGVDEDG